MSNNVYTVSYRYPDYNRDVKTVTVMATSVARAVARLAPWFRKQYMAGAVIEGVQHTATIEVVDR